MDDCLPKRSLVAHGPASQVEECTCGILHVTIGALTVRLQVEVVASLAETLTEAVRRIEARSPEIASRCLPGELPS